MHCVKCYDDVRFSLKLQAYIPNINSTLIKGSAIIFLAGFCCCWRRGQTTTVIVVIAVLRKKMDEPQTTIGERARDSEAERKQESGLEISTCVLPKRAIFKIEYSYVSACDSSHWQKLFMCKL